MSWRHLFVITATALAAACQPMASFEPEQPEPPQGSGIAADAPVTTNAARYTLVRDGDGLGTTIGIRFENRSDRRMYIVNCRGGLAPVLEKRVNGAWVEYWTPVLLQCLSAPIVIEPGATLERDLPIWGALPSTNSMPTWASADIDGTYRIVLHQVVWNYDDRRQGFGDPVPLHLRTSNEFILQR